MGTTTGAWAGPAGECVPSSALSSQTLRNRRHPAGKRRRTPKLVCSPSSGSPGDTPTEPGGELCLRATADPVPRLLGGLRWHLLEAYTFQARRPIPGEGGGEAEAPMLKISSQTSMSLFPGSSQLLVTVQRERLKRRGGGDRNRKCLKTEASTNSFHTASGTGSGIRDWVRGQETCRKTSEVQTKPEVD